MWQYPPLHQLLKTILSWPVIHQVARGSGRKRTKNKRTIWARVNLSARRVVLWHSIPCASNASVYFLWNFYKATRNANSSWLAFPHCSWTLSHADWSLLLSIVDCPSASPFANSFSEFLFPTTLWRSLAHFRSHQRSRAQAFVWFRAKTNKKVVCWRTPFIVSHNSSSPFSKPLKDRS